MKRTRTTHAGSIPRVYGYCRVSTDMQAQHGLSLAAQEEEIKRYAAERGWMVAEIFVDGGFSAKNTERPAFQRMARLIKSGQDAVTAVVVTKLDRLTRSLRDLLSIYEDLLEPNDCNFVAIRDGINTCDPLAKMIMPFLAIIGQIERQNTSERVRIVRQHIVNQGGHYGKVPFGFVTVREGKLSRLVPCPTTHVWRERLIAWYGEGVAMTEIARRLNAAGVKPRYVTTCAEWTPLKIYDLLVRIGVHRKRNEVDSARIPDKRAAFELANRLRNEGSTLPQIAEALTAANLRPLRAAKYEWYSVQTLLRTAVLHDRSTPRGLAQYLKDQGHSLREIGQRLAQAGHHPKRGGQWHAHTVKLLMAS